MIKFKKDKNIDVKKIYIKDGKRKIPALVLMPKERKENVPGVMWIHGGGYILGMKEMVYASRAIDLVKNYGAVVISPGYRLALFHPYPAAINDCYTILLYLKEHSKEYGINENQIMVGGESAGAGLCVALTMMARDKGEVKIAFQMPLYPMIDNFDTDSSKDNHGKIWNTKRNHFAWKKYLRKDVHSEVSPYAAPARQKDYSNLPPAYTFVGDGEPFFSETITYIDNLKKAGVEAEVDVYHTNIHAFDMMRPDDELSKKAIKKFNDAFEYAVKTFFIR